MLLFFSFSFSFVHVQPCFEVIPKSSVGKKSEWLFKAVAELLRGREGKATDRTRLESSRNRSMQEPGLPHISDTWSGTERQSRLPDREH